jgi:hypothetical protein
MTADMCLRAAGLSCILMERHPFLFCRGGNDIVFLLDHSKEREEPVPKDRPQGRAEFYEIHQKVSNITHLSDALTPLTGVCCGRYVGLRRLRSGRRKRDARPHGGTAPLRKVSRGSGIQ